MRYTVTKAFRPKGSGSPEAAIGSELELTASQARVFKAVGFVKDAEPKVADTAAEQTVRTYMRRDMTAESESSAIPARKVAAKKTSRTYTRRTAE
jgi:hypothetical protein